MMPTPNGSHRNVRRALLAALAFGSLALILASGSVPCAFAELTHVPCPGCGSTRAVHALVHGDLGGALRANPLGPVVAMLFGAFAVLAILSVLRDGTLAGVHDGRAARFVTRALVVTVVLEIVVWVARFFGALGGPVPV